MHNGQACPCPTLHCTAGQAASGPPWAPARWLPHTPHPRWGRRHAAGRMHVQENSGRGMGAWQQCKRGNYAPPAWQPHHPPSHSTPPHTHLHVGHHQVLGARLAQDLGEHLDGLAARKEVGHGHARHARHLNLRPRGRSKHVWLLEQSREGRARARWTGKWHAKQQVIVLTLQAASLAPTQPWHALVRPANSPSNLQYIPLFATPHVVVHVHQLVHQPLGQVGILRAGSSGGRQVGGRWHSKHALLRDACCLMEASSTFFSRRVPRPAA